MTSDIDLLTPSARLRAEFVLDDEARALGVDRRLFKPAAKRRRLSGKTAAWVRELAPNWAVAIGTAGCPAPLASALENAHRRSTAC